MGEAEAFIAAVRGSFPEVASTVRTCQVAHALLAHKATLVEDIAHSGAARLLLLPPARTWSDLPGCVGAAADRRMQPALPWGIFQAIVFCFCM